MSSDYNQRQISGAAAEELLAHVAQRRRDAVHFCAARHAGDPVLFGDWPRSDRIKIGRGEYGNERNCKNYYRYFEVTIFVIYLSFCSLNATSRKAAIWTRNPYRVAT